MAHRPPSACSRIFTVAIIHERAELPVPCYFLPAGRRFDSPRSRRTDRFAEPRGK
jgi:hypothetical protein